MESPPPPPDHTESTSKPTDLLSLPNELLQRISDSLPAEDVLKFRLVNKQLSMVGLRTVQDNRHILYLEISSASLERFKQVCDSKRFASSIKHIVYVARKRQWSKEELAESFDFMQNCLEPTWRARILDVYERRRADQAEILRRGGIESMLRHAVDALPNLQVVTFSTTWDEALRPNSFNWALHWSWCNMTQDNIHECMETHPGRYIPEAAYRWDSLGSIFSAIAYHATVRPSKPLSLGFYQTPLDLLPTIMQGFSTENSQCQEAAMSHVHRLEVVGWQGCTERGSSYEWSFVMKDLIENKLKPLARRHWMPLFRSARNLREVAIRYPALEGDALTDVVLTETFPGLHKLEIDNTYGYGGGEGIHHDDGSTGHHPFEHTTQTLIGFLDRHSSILQGLHLTCATGVDASSRLPSCDRLRTFLGLIRSKCPDLRNSNIYECRGVHLPGEYNDTNDPELKRSMEEMTKDDVMKKSNLARLAGEVGLQPAVSMNSSRYTSSLLLKFDFGSWVLQKANVTG